MNLECEHASILGKKMSPFGRAVMEIFSFFSVSLLMAHPEYPIKYEYFDKYFYIPNIQLIDELFILNVPRFDRFVNQK
jgi:hypothetical protein